MNYFGLSVYRKAAIYCRDLMWIDRKFHSQEIAEQIYGEVLEDNPNID